MALPNITPGTLNHTVSFPYKIFDLKLFEYLTI